MSDKAMPENLVYVCLPGETAKGLVAGCKNRVIKRKHRDVVIQINIKPNATYTLRTDRSDFYSERDKLLHAYHARKSMSFKDGERIYVWISRDFSGKLIIESSGKVLGEWYPNKLDNNKYDKDPMIKPEPLMIILNSKPATSNFLKCTAADPYGHSAILIQEDQLLQGFLNDEKMKKSQYSYLLGSMDKPELQEHYIAGTISKNELTPAAIQQLERLGGQITGAPDQLFKEPQKGSQLEAIIANVVEGTNTAMTSNDSPLTANYFKETAGYIQSHWRRFNMLGMRVYIERSKIGMYRYVFKGRLITPTGLSKLKTVSMPVGSNKAEFLGSNHHITGRRGLGGFKRVFLTAKGNFRAGMKIQGVGTVIDLYGDFATTFGDGKSNDMSEFFGRAGVSIFKAGSTAALGGLITAGIMFTAAAAASAVGVTITAPVWLGAMVVVGGYILAATVIDYADSAFNIKETVAGWAR
ncbi:hypothetical protein [Chromobacterium piscinae]|uniref:hypothetical protein n=1 Tax=Chromobacterium piscinae TaxID=686831 RepID=UPI00320B6830